MEDSEKKYIEGIHTFISILFSSTTLSTSGTKISNQTVSTKLLLPSTLFLMLSLIVDGKPVKIIINLEPQKTSRKIHYKLIKRRAVYYFARLISDQKEKEFHGDDYNAIKKIYTIWIYMAIQNYCADSIQRYNLTEEIIHSNFRDDPSFSYGDEAAFKIIDMKITKCYNHLESEVIK